MDWSAMSARELRKHAIGLLILAVLFVASSIKMVMAVEPSVTFIWKVREDVLTYGMCGLLLLVSTWIAVHASTEIARLNRLLAAHTKADTKVFVGDDEILEEDMQYDVLMKTEKFVKHS